MNEENVIFDTNREIIQQRWPHIIEYIESLEGDLDVTIVDDKPQTTLIFNGRHLSSCYNRSNEAQIQNSNVPQSAKIAHLYGAGLGDAIYDLLKRDSLNHLDVYLLSPTIFYIYISLFDAQDWLNDKRVQLHLAHEAILKTPYSVNYTELSFTEDSALTVKNLIEIDKNTAHQKRFHQDQKALNNENMKNNQSFLEIDPYIDDLKNKHQGRRFVLVAGGPTASEQFSWMREKRKEYILIAASTALVSLELEDLIPDYVVAIDSSARLAQHFKVKQDSIYKNTMLCYVPTITTEILQSWPGLRRMFLSMGNPVLSPLAQQRPQSSLYSGGSVAHAQAALAVFLGAKEVTLVGYDFCFVENQSHLSNNPLQYKAPVNTEHYLLNGYQQKMPSYLNLIGYKYAMEEYIELHPSVIFYNTGRNGAEIKGAKWL